MNPKIKKIVLFPFSVLYRISPKATLKILFRMKNGYKLDLENPKTYNQKLQWVKLNYKNPLLPKLVDKYTVRDYIGEKAPELLTKLYWNGFDAKDIPWDELPDKFVIKVTHGSGYNIICKDKSALDIKACTKKINKWLKEKFLRCYGEWFYGVEKPRIIIEEFLDNGTNKEPEDYKIFCFNGKPKYVIVDTDRFAGHKRNVYDLEWNLLDNVTMNFPNDKPIDKPSKLTELLKYAEILSEALPHVRVDLYVVNDKLYFGELTFANGSGFDKITPFEFDVELGTYFSIAQ